MEHYDYINSKDIREYLKEKAYKFRPQELAWLIYQCRKMDVTMQDKWKAWETIIAEMPDSRIEERCNLKAMDSLHQYLRDYMMIQKKLLDIFEDSADAVYTYQAFSTSDQEWYEEHAHVFRSWEAAFEDAKDYFEYDISVIDIKKHYLDHQGQEIIVRFNTDRQQLDLTENQCLEQEESELYYSFEGMWFEIPVPFKKGDILCECYSEGIIRTGLCHGPFVLTHEINGSFSDYVRKWGDSSDMSVGAYFAEREGVVYREVFSGYMDLEYYRGVFPDGMRVLKAFSAYEKDEIDVVMLARAYHQIATEEIVKSLYFNDYPQEWKTACGLDENTNPSYSRRKNVY